MPQPHTLLPDRTATRYGTVPPAFRCNSRNGGVGAPWVRAAGELDLATAPGLAVALGDALHEASLVVLDLRELTFLDSAGVHAIVDASIGARRDGCRLLLVPAPAEVHRIFALTGASDDVDVCDLDSGELPVQVLLQRSRRSVAVL